MSRPDGSILVLGIGNVLLCDEGAGVRIAQALMTSAQPLPSGARIVEGGTLGLELLPLLDDASAVVFLDAVNVQAPPGTVAILRGTALEQQFALHLSAHQVGAADLLAVARFSGALPAQCALVGIQPGLVDYGLSLSPPVQAALEEAVATAYDIVMEFAGSDVQ